MLLQAIWRCSKVFGNGSVAKGRDRLAAAAAQWEAAERKVLLARKPRFGLRSPAPTACPCSSTFAWRRSVSISVLASAASLAGAKRQNLWPSARTKRTGAMVGWSGRQVQLFFYLDLFWYNWFTHLARSCRCHVFTVSFKTVSTMLNTATESREWKLNETIHFIFHLGNMRTQYDGEK